MPVDPDKLAASLGAVDPDSLAAELGGEPAVSVKGHVRAKPGFLKRLAQTQARNLPVYGGTAGAILGAGTPATPVGGAMLGAAAGKAIEQALAPALGEASPTNPLDAYAQQANAAALQGAFEGVPSQVLAPAAKVAGGAFARSQMARALKPSVGIVRNFPEVVQDAIRQGATVNRWFGKGGARASEQVRRDATGKVVGLLRAAGRRGESIDIEAVARPAIEAVEKKAGPLLPEARQQLIGTIQDRADELLLKSVLGTTRRSTQEMTPMMADELRKAAARSSRATLTAESMGLPSTAIPDLDRLIAKGAGNAVKELHGVRAARKAEQAAIGVYRAVKGAEDRPVPADVGVGVGPIKAGIGVPPGLASRLALASQGLGSPMLGPIISNLVRAAYAARPYY